MPIYDHVRPSEQHDPSSPDIKRPKHEKRQHLGNRHPSPASPSPISSPCVYVSAPRSPLEPVSVQPIRPLTPYPVLLRQDVPDLSHESSTESSTDSSASEKDRGPPQCHRCGPIPEQTGLNTQANDCCICVEIMHEPQGRSTLAPGSADPSSSTSHALRNHRHKRHSLFYAPTSQSESGPPLGQLFNLLGQGSTPLEAESDPLEEERNPLQADSKPLEYEATPLEEAHHYEDPYYAGAEERLSRHRVTLDDWEDFCRVQKARSELRQWVEKEKALPASTLQNQGNQVRRGRSPERR